MLDAIGIVSRDLQRSVEFYKILGIHFSKSPGSEDHWEAETPSGVRLMLDSHELMKRLKPGWVAPTGGAITLGLLQPSPSAVDALYRKLEQGGYRLEVEPWDAFWGQRYATVVDPDGNPVDLFASLEASE